MDTANQSVQLVGFISILSCLTFLLVRIVYFFVGGRHRRLRYSFETITLLSIIYYAVNPGFHWAGIDSYISDAVNFIAFLWWVNLAFSIDSMLRLYAWDGILSEQGERQVPKLVTAAVSLLLYSSAIIIVLHFFYDKPITALMATSGALAMILGFAAQSTLKEVFAGISLNATKAICMGDFVEIEGVYGQIYDINWRSISIKNPHTDSLYVFPNSIVASQNILNFSEPTGRFKYYITFMVEPSAPPEKVIRAILDELAYSRHVFREPKPDFNILGFTDIGIEIRIRFFFDGDDPWWDAQNEVCMAVWAAMKKYGFRLSIKRAHLGSEDEWVNLNRTVTTYSDSDKISAALSKNTLFNHLNAEEIHTLASASQVVDLGPPSYFYRPGDIDPFFYIVLEGEVGIYSPHKQNEICIETCSPGDAFGLTNFHSDHKRANLAQAGQYSIVARIPLASLRDLLEKNRGSNDRLLTATEEKTLNRDRYMQSQLLRKDIDHHVFHKKNLTIELKKSVDKLLHQHWVQHIRTHASKSHRNTDFLEAMMAGMALILSAEHLPHAVKAERVRALLQTFNVLKYLNKDECLAAFASYNEKLEENVGTGTQYAFNAIREISGHKHKAELVLAICFGILNEHELPSKEEVEIIANLADKLDLHSDIAVLTQSLRDKRLSKEGH